MRVSDSMEKKIMVEQLLKKGILVSPEELERMNETNNKKNITSEEYVKELLEKHKTLEREILRKTEPTSINKIGFTGASIVGVVTEKTENGFVLQDATNEVNVISSSEAEKGNLIGVKGFMRNGFFVSDEILWPDIPLQRKANNLPKTMFAERRAAGDFVSPGTKETHYMEKGKLSILFFHGGIDEETGVRILKSRMIPGIIPFLITKIPDFFWILGSKNWFRTYKGVAIISTDSDSYAIYENGNVLFKKY
jgi:hypothetical protein